MNKQRFYQNGLPYLRSHTGEAVKILRKKGILDTLDNYGPLCKFMPFKRSDAVSEFSEGGFIFMEFLDQGLDGTLRTYRFEKEKDAELTVL